MKRLLVTAGGTATAWHLVNVAREFFANDLCVHVADVNESYLVPAACLAKKFHKVPYSSDSKYIEAVQRIILDEDIDIIVPLIPEESLLFARDSAFVKENRIGSSAPLIGVTKELTDKECLAKTLDRIGVPTPTIYESINDVEEDSFYMVKPKYGFGSIGISIYSGKVLKCEKIDLDKVVISEYCHDDDYDEVTVEVYNGKIGLHTYARRRVATKNGVCVKMIPVDNTLFDTYIRRLVNSIECPTAFNAQFLYHHGQWKLFDCNLRLGAGTALSTAAGFQLTRAFLAELIGLPVEESWLTPDCDIKSVLRVYREIVIK